MWVSLLGRKGVALMAKKRTVSKILNADVTKPKLEIELTQQIIYVFKKHKKIFVMDDEDAVVTLLVQMTNELTERHIVGNEVQLFSSIDDLKKVKDRVNRFKKLLTMEINENIETAMRESKR